MSEKNFPTTLQQAVIYFADEDRCVEFVAALRWPNGAICPTCRQGEPTTYYLAKYRRWNCRDCRKQFSVKSGTIFEESPIPLNKWVAAVWLIAGAKNGISSYEIHRGLGVTQKSAWFMMHRIRLAMTQGTFEMMGGEGETIEVDETYIGGLARNKHKRERVHGRTGGAGKTAVFGLLERNKNGKSKVRTQVIPEAWKDAVNVIIKDTVERGSNIYSDEHGAYYHLGSEVVS